MPAPILSALNTARLRLCLDKLDADYTPAVRMVRSVWNGPGYHSLIPNGRTVHETRSALDYTLLLLASGESDHLKRAQAVISAVLALQETDPTRPTYGIWPWLQEESLSEMSPPDWNWADFCGVRLAHALAVYPDRLEPELREKMAKSLGHAARSIFRRNVGPGYTNIAIKGGLVCAVAGELLHEPSLLDYGQRRLEAVLAYSLHHEGYNEFNSPNYGLLVLTELERGLLMSREPAVRGLLERLHDFSWSQMAGTFHATTGQFCGPQSRAYQDLLSDEFIDRIEATLGLTLFRARNRRPAKEEPSVGALLIPRRPCAPEVRSIIAGEGTAAQATFHRQFFVKSPDPAECREASVWRSPEACVGSMTVGNFWVQQRSILGYWRVGKEVATLRVRMTHDDRDFASGALRVDQRNNQLVAIASLETGQGDHHVNLDKPEDGIFCMTQLSLSIEVHSTGAKARGDETAGFVLTAGDWEVTVRPAFAFLSGHSVKWMCAEEEGVAKVCALVDDGRPIELEPTKIAEAALGFYLALHPTGCAPAVTGMHGEKAGHDIRLIADTANGQLVVSSPLKPIPTAWFRG